IKTRQRLNTYNLYFYTFIPIHLSPIPLYLYTFIPIPLYLYTSTPTPIHLYTYILIYLYTYILLYTYTPIHSPIQQITKHQRSNNRGIRFDNKLRCIDAKFSPRNLLIGDSAGV